MLACSQPTMCPGRRSSDRLWARGRPGPASSISPNARCSSRIGLHELKRRAARSVTLPVLSITALTARASLRTRPSAAFGGNQRLLKPVSIRRRALEGLVGEAQRRLGLLRRASSALRGGALLGGLGVVHRHRKRRTDAARSLGDAAGSDGTRRRHARLAGLGVVCAALPSARSCARRPCRGRRLLAARSALATRSAAALPLQPFPCTGA